MICRKCGTKFDAKYGVCPKCGTIYENIDDSREKNKTTDNNSNKVKLYTGMKKTSSSKKDGGITGYTFGVAFAGLLILGIIVALVIKAVSGGNGTDDEGGGATVLEKTEEVVNLTGDSQGAGFDDPDTNSENNPEGSTNKNADAYYAEKAEVLSVSSVEESDVVFSESETARIMKERGFTSEEITTDYSISGEYLGENVKISEDADIKHPIYQLEYMNSAGEFWMVLLTGNAIIANPLSYNLSSDLGVMVAVSEKESVISYDCTGNRFFETIPKKSEVIVLQKNRIDATLLDELTVEEIDRCVR